MARRTKCTFCGAPVDLSSTRCKFCNQDYDSEYHHGPGENRALALGSGLRFGGSKGKNKDAYYNMFCLGN